MKRKKYISIFTGIFVFFLTILNIQPVKAVTATFSQESQYQSGGYDLNAVQPTTYNWTRQSKYVGPENGFEKWYCQIGGQIRASSPAIGSDGTIYVGSWDDKLYAINPDGTEKWSYATGGIIDSSPVIGSDGTIYVGSEDNKLYAIDSTNGNQEWAYTLSSWGQIKSSPAIGSDRTIYVSSTDGNLYAIDSNGKKKWSYNTNSSQIASSPAIGSDGTIYVGSYDGNLYAIDPNGKKKWACATGNEIFLSSPAIGSDGTIYIGSYDGNLHAIKPDGTEKWSCPIGARTDSSPAIGSDGTIYIGSYDCNLYAVKPDGTEKWAYSTRGIINSSPTIDSNGTIYVGSEDNNLYAINSDGTKKWSCATWSTIDSSPAIGSDGTIYIGSQDFCLHAIKNAVFASTTDSSTSNDISTLGLTGTSASSDNTDIATATVNTTTGKIDITSVAVGTATITVTDVSGHTATIPVTVNADGSITIGDINMYVVTVTSVAALPDIDVPNGTALVALHLPSTVDVTLSDSTIISATIVWRSKSNPSYDGNTPGTYTFTGNLQGVTNPNGIKATVNVIVGVPATVPDAPTNVTATTGNASASLTWTAPTNYGGSPVTDYLIDVYSSGNLENIFDTHSTTTSATVVNLTNGTPYTFNVMAVNSIGDSTTSSATTVVTPTAPAAPATVPDVPTGVAATAGNGSVSLTWMAPINDGGSPITDYLIDVYSSGNLENIFDTHSTTTSATVVNLTNGTSYIFDVMAVNSIGDSTTSSATSVVVPTAPHESSGSSGSGTGSTSTPTSSEPTITANVVDGENGSTPGISVKATVTANSDGTDTVSVKPSDAVVMKQPDGSTIAFEDYSKIGYSTPSDASVTINSDGTVEISNLAKGNSYDIPVTYDMGNSQKIIIGNMHISVDSTGNVNMTSSLIDPYGTLTDSLSGKAISGANVTLYYADTARNRAEGKTPGTMVELPAINGFKPNNNANPQVTDSNGAYGYMVYANTDYYIVVTKDGYDTYTSPTISVGTELVEFSAKLNPPVTGVKRVAGATRVDTAIELAKSEFTGKINSIIFATADNYPDALTGSVLAYQQKAPILLVGASQEDQDKVLTYMKDYLASNGKVFLLGGTGVVTENFADEVKAAGYSNVIRLGGTDRYETATKIADYLNIAEGTPVIIASGENYPDALAVSSAAAINQYPILLVTNNSISDLVKSELAKIKPSKVYIIGGQGAISDTVQSQLAELTSLDSNSIVRLGGADRYSTSITVANSFKLPGKSACIATGTNFPDALAGSIYAANYNAPIILVGKTLTDEEKSYIQNSKLSGATIFGGEGAVNNEVESEVTGLLSK